MKSERRGKMIEAGNYSEKGLVKLEQEWVWLGKVGKMRVRG
jgi:hypothetical protein